AGDREVWASPDSRKALKSEGVTPIALGGGDRWPTLMWFEYLYDRIAGPELFEKALAGDREVWASPDSRKALKSEGVTPIALGGGDRWP
ncbi:hypothetical protein ADL35_27680, partial [Streptomyces sp. NRRL WC-3753]